MPLALLLLLCSRPAVLHAQTPVSQTAPGVSDKDICSYLKDVEAKTDADCSTENLAALKSKNPETGDLALKRKADVLKAYDVLKSSPPPEAAPAPLQPLINDRTFAAWMPDAKDLKDVETHRLQFRNQALQKEKKSPATPERQKEIDAELSANQARLAALDKIRDPGQFTCYLDEGCGAKPDTATPAVPSATGRGPWTPEDYARANVVARGQTRVPGGRLDNAVPDLGSVASDAFANTPLGPLRDKTHDGSSSPFGTAALTAFGLAGGLLLFGGLAGPQLEDKFPNIRRNMGIGAFVGGVVATGALAWEGGATRVAATAAPVAANPNSEEEARGMISGRPVLQRVSQIASDLVPEEEASVQKFGSQFLTRADRLLNGQQARIDIRKLTEYALNPDHDLGKNKARVFASALGYTRDNFEDLVTQIRAGILANPAIPGEVDRYGTRFNVDIMVKGPTGQAVVRTGWIYLAGSQVPTMTTVFVR